MTDLHNAIRQAPEISRGMRRWFGGDDLVTVERLSETIYPVMDFWDHDEHPEAARLRNEHLWAGVVSEAGVVGEFTAIAVANQSLSQIVTVDKFGFESGAAGNVSVRQALVTSLGTLATSSRMVARDFRGMVATGLVVRTTMLSGTDVLSSYGGQIMDFVEATPNVVTYSEHGPWVLGPGEALLGIFTGATNTALRAHARGVEREARPGELSG